MISTAEKVLAHCTGLKRQHDGSYRGACPFRSDSDSNGFVLNIHDGEHGAWTDHARLESGSLYDLAHKLGIETPKEGRAQVDNSKRSYTNLEDYAKRHYSTLKAFQDAGWQDGEYYGKKALVYQTTTGKRIRIIEGNDAELKNPYRWEKVGSENCWYGLNRAIPMASGKNVPLVFCNGEASTVVAQAHGIPAFCGVGGEGAISESMLSELKTRWQGQIYICLDCDEKGRLAAQKVKEKLENAVTIDLELSDKGDLADFCGLHQGHALDALKRLAKTEKETQTSEIEDYIEFVSGNELLAQFKQFVWEQPELFGRVIEMPFASLRKAGGFAEYMTTKKIWLIGNVSGGGKTILSETLCDEWNALGYNVFYVGDEWTPMELTARRIVRATKGTKPVSYSDYLAYVNGKRVISDSELEGISYAIRSIRSHHGQPFYMKTKDNAKDVVFLEDILETLSKKISLLRASGTKVDIVILDYLSLYETRGRSNNLEEYKIGVFKSYCKSLDVLGVSTVQVNKDAEERVKHKGGFLTQHDLYYVRADKGNLISTMNRLYKTRGEVESWNNLDKHDMGKPYIDENGQPEPTPNFAMITVKNSVSSPYEYAYFYFDFERMRVCEGIHPDYYFDKGMGQIMPKTLLANIENL